MRVMVTGSAGFLGHSVLNCLAHKGHELVQIDAKLGQNLLEDPNLDQWFDGVDCVVHLAASPLAKSVKNPVEDAYINICGTVRVLRMMLDKSVKRIIFTSASSVYGPGYRGAVQEGLPLRPAVPYAVAKVCAEQYLEFFGRTHGISWTALRLFNVYGPEQSPDSGALIPVTLDRLSRGLPVRLTGSGSGERDFVFVDDVSEMIASLVDAVDLPNAPMNLGSGIPTKIKRVAEIAGETLGVDPKFEYTPAPEGRPDLGYHADISLLKRWTGSGPRTSIEEGIRLCSHRYLPAGGTA